MINYLKIMLRMLMFGKSITNPVKSLDNTGLIRYIVGVDVVQ